ncbi:hypothetical protein CWE08_02010 [Aliidiomarina iranensis]|uniref:Solute-binding protein family 3/N-terminal domain-containing protein n=1 Tax=Aliidiomarina iranensis TaxID=1434071 RepID=A0A432W2L7_9GAMM|nr:hypothetical protein [Aliidiomarina iranensis]RUO23444.1 hypothetical protein CWE08_02010 [Aliidiomarina iranensis]
MQMKRCVWIFSFAFVLAASYALAEQELDFEQSPAKPQPVFVAAYEFPPYYSSRMPKHFLGELIAVLNQRQEEYQFIIREVRPQERYEAISAEGCCDVIFFESEVWGWQQDMNYVASVPIMHGSDRLYSTQNAYWQPKALDRVGGVVGYHYSFTQYQIDIDTSERDFMMYRADSQQTLLTMLRNKRLQFAVFTDEYMNWLQVEQPELLNNIYAAPEPDGTYTTQIIFSESSAISPQALMTLLQELLAEPELQEWLERYALILATDNLNDRPIAPSATQIE